jgi:hypothetical protein
MKKTRGIASGFFHNTLRFEFDLHAGRQVKVR